MDAVALEHLLERALELPPAERRLWIEASIAEPELRERVRRIVARAEGLGDFLERPAAEALAAGSAEDASPGLGEGGMGIVDLAEQGQPVERRRLVKTFGSGSGAAGEPAAALTAEVLASNRARLIRVGQYFAVAVAGMSVLTLAAVAGGWGTWGMARAILVVCATIAAASLGLIAAGRSMRWSDQAVFRLGLGFFVLLCGVLGFGHAVHETHQYGVVTAFGIHILALAVFPLVIPSPPRLTLGVSLAGGATAVAGIALAVRAGMATVVDGTPYVDLATMPLVIAAMAYAISAQIARLRAAAAAPATRLGSYRLESRIGSGGMGEIWQGRHALLARPVAIKTMRLTDGLGSGAALAEARTRFRREARATTDLRSPHIVDVYDFGIAEDGSFYYVMELLKGLDLAAMVKRHGPQSEERVVGILLQASHAVAEAHRSGLVHRDLKPANVMVCRMGDAVEVVKVLDFGVAGWMPLAGELTSNGLTRTGVFLGTPAFSAPEVLAGQRADVKSDLYSLAGIGYWLLAGCGPFDAPSPAEGLAARLHGGVRPLSSRGLPVSSGLESAILGCLAREPGDRPAGAAAFAAALEATGIRPWTAVQARDWWAEHEPASEPSEVAAPGSPNRRPTE